MKAKYIIIVFVAAFFPLSVQAQEQLVGLHGNTVIEQFLQCNQSSGVALKSQMLTTFESLWLPFFDDFTYDGPYPDEALWGDNFAFVNTSFQKNPANRGVATLDALDAEGKIYSHASPYPFMADYLTSRPIRTDSIIINDNMQRLSPSDSLYLSFFYQPQGLGDAPERNDSLVLEFFVKYADTIMYIDSTYHAADTLWNVDNPEIWDEIYAAYWEKDTTYNIIPEQWRHVWSSPGMPIDTFYAKHKQWMAQEMIPITDIADFRSDFRFRFRNYASLPDNTLPSWQSNMDQWNIDYVYLNYNRFAADMTYSDISFVNPGESFLQNFSAMPYRQYEANPYSAMKPQFTTVFTNLSNVTQNADYSYRIYDPDGNQVGTDEQYSNVEWTNTILPAITTGIQSEIVPIVMMFPTAGVFSIKQTLIDNVSHDPRLSDSITYLQVFDNYFAYDDGTPEAGYGLTPTQAMLAVRFPLNTPRDTLQAVDIFFNTTPTRQSEGHIEYFRLMVWNDNHGEPGDTLYTSNEVLYSGEAGQFIRFPVNRMVLLPSGFFVGVQQSTADNINIGFDYSNDMGSRNMYKIYNDPWKKSYYQGSIMIRPVMGTPDITVSPSQTPPSTTIAVFPNPLTSEQQIRIQKPDSFADDHEITLKIYDGVGKQCYEAPYTKPEVTLNNLYNGMFIIKLYNLTTGETATTKLMITK
ncbi:MAG: hypothetical protein FWG84_08830 [Bacteroidales bacterium]|nr:hypothetical protein [Bacteroidales bacterium]